MATVAVAANLPVAAPEEELSASSLQSKLRPVLLIEVSAKFAVA